MCERCGNDECKGRDDGDDSHIEMREMLDEILKGEAANNRMVTIRMSVLAAPVAVEMLKLGLSLFQHTNSDLDKVDAIDLRFAKMAARAAGLEMLKDVSPERYDTLLAKAPEDVRRYMTMPPEERDRARKAHKAMALLSLAECATLPEELASEVTRIMAEKGTTSAYHLPPRAVETIDEFVEARRKMTQGDEDEVKVILIGRPGAVREFAKKHGLNPEDIIGADEGEVLGE